MTITRQLILHITTRSGGLTITSPQLPGWAASPTRPTGILDAVAAGFRELDVAAYAQRHAVRYDMPARDEDAPFPTLPTLAGRAPTSIEGWRPLAAGEALTTKRGKIPHPCEAGSWMSPRGMVFAPDTRMARRVTALRLAAGLSTSADGRTWQARKRPSNGA